MPSAPPSRSARQLLRLGALGDILLLRAGVSPAEAPRATASRCWLPRPRVARSWVRDRPEPKRLLDSDRADLARLWTADAEPPDEIARPPASLAYAVSP